MNKQEQSYTLEQLTAYLMIYAAHADFEVSDQEAKLIVDKIGRQNYEEISDLYEKQSDYEAANFIQEQCAIHITSKADKDNLLAEMKKVFLADEHISFLETAILKAVSRLIS